MSFRYAILGSGSHGNATVVDGGGTRVLIDCGFGVRELASRAARIGLDLSTIRAVLVTHEHGDHFGGVARVGRALKVPLMMTRGTALGRRDWTGCQVQTLSPHQAFTIGDLDVEPFPVPHDAREPCHFRFEYRGTRLGMVSDLGHTTPHVKRTLDACDALLLEFNHDVQMLANGPYPQVLKRRVGGRLGHLSNVQAAQFLRELDRSRLRELVLTHLSQKNNTPELARAAACEALDDDPAWLSCAEQDQGSGWREIA